MTNSTSLTDSYQLVASGATFFLVQSNVEAHIYFGASAPADDTALGFKVPADVPYRFDSVAEMGGSVWAKGTGVLVYATDA